MRVFLLSGMLWFGCLMQTPPAFADTPPLTGPVLLTVVLPNGTEDQWDLARLRALPGHSFTTTTIWTKAPQTFQGVRLPELLNELGVNGNASMTLVAANGHQVSIETGTRSSDDALIAYQRNGAAMTLRDKGPLWLVYNYDADPILRSEVIYANSIWQLDRVEIE